MIKKPKINLSLILNLEEYFSLEDYSNFLMIRKSIYDNSFFDINKEWDYSKYVNVTFPINTKSKEITIPKKSLKRIYCFIRIISDKKGYINILKNKNENNVYDPNEIINHINSLSFFKGPIIRLLKMDKYPLINKYLEEVQIYSNMNINKDIEKLFIIKDKPKNINENNNSSGIPKINNYDYNNSPKDVNGEKNYLIFRGIKIEYLFPKKGLNNVGLTCYMNSTLQLLLHVSELNNFFINIYPEQEDKLKRINKDVETKGRLSQEYYKVVKNIFGNNNDSFSPRDFNTLISNLNPQFSKFQSNDSKDLLLYLFQSMHAELNFFGEKSLKNVPKCNQLNEKESFNFFMEVNNNLNLSIFSYLFYGIIKSQTICCGCNSILYNFQFFQFLSFPTFNYKNKLFNIYQGFKEFIKKERMIGDNQCYCQKCKELKDAEVNSIIYYTPPYLIINIDYGKDKKYNPNKILFGGIIDLTGFIDSQCTEKTYELIAICTHIGRSGNSGHYITYCKDNNNKWHKFNDSYHSICNFEEVNSNSPYLLLFKRI